MVMVGYAQNAPVGTYRMWNPKTQKVITPDSVTWAKFNKWSIVGDPIRRHEEAQRSQK